MKRWHFKILVIIFLLSSNISAVGFKPARNISGGSLNGVCLTHISQPYAVFYNPALAAFVKNKFVLTGYYKPYQIPDLQYSFIEGIIPVKGTNGIPVHYNLIMADNYRESELSLGYAYKLLDGTAIGVQVNGYHIGIKRYPQYWGVGLNFGFISSPFENLYTAAVFKNFLGYEADNINIGIEPSLKMELGYILLQKTFAAIQVNHDLNRKLGYGFSIKHLVYENINFLMGILPENEQWNLGINLNTSSFLLSYALFFHSVLEETHSIGFNFKW